MKHKDKGRIPDYIRVSSQEKLKLSKIPTRVKNASPSDEEYKARLDSNHQQIEEFQNLLYANHDRALLIIFQGMDSAGKDGAIKHVMSGVNPQGCTVVSFKTPTSTELSHDYLWRINKALPERGMIGIFNRSYYEEVLITRVHPDLILQENLPAKEKINSEFWSRRYEDIVNYERYLSRQGYEIVKIFIHISKAEQKLRLIDRFKDPSKHWKISEGDIHERGFWDEYQSAYQECIANTASDENPWYIVAGDDKPAARLSIAQLLVDRFDAMKLRYPKLSHEQKKELKKMKSVLLKE